MSEYELISFIDASADELEEFLHGATPKDGPMPPTDGASTAAQPVTSFIDDRESRVESPSDHRRFDWRRTDELEFRRKPAAECSTDRRSARYDRSPSLCRKSRHDDRLPAAADRHSRAADWGRENDGERHEARYSRRNNSIDCDRSSSPRADHQPYRREVSSRPRSISRRRDVSTTRERYGYAVGAKLGTYSGNSCLETFLAKFNNCARYFKWNSEDKLFQLCASLEGPAGQILWETEKHTNVEQVIKLLRSRFGSINQAERFRAELRSRRRFAGESLQQLYQDICRLMALSYPGPSSELSNIVGRDCFVQALNNPQLQVRILEKEPATLEEALKVACRLEALDKSASQGESVDEEHSRAQRKHVRTAMGNSQCADNQADLSRQLEELREEIQMLRSQRVGWDTAACEGADHACKGAFFARESAKPDACKSADHVARNCASCDEGNLHACKGESFARKSAKTAACKSAVHAARDCASRDKGEHYACKGASFARESAEPASCKSADHDARNRAFRGADYPSGNGGRRTYGPTSSGFAPPANNFESRQGFNSRGPAHSRRPEEVNSGCWECGSTDHWARNCPRAKGGQTTWANGRKEPHYQFSGPRANVISSRIRGAEVYMPVQLHGRRMLCLLDTGCEVSIIGRRMVPDVPLEPTDRKLFAANGTEIPVLGKTTLEFAVRSGIYSASLVVSDAVQEMILGIDWLQTNECQWNFGSGTVSVRGRSIKLCSKPQVGVVRRIYVDEDCVVAARSQRDLPAQITWPDLRTKSEGWAMEPRTVRDGVIVARTLMADHSLHSAVRIVNATDKANYFKAGTYLGAAQAVQVCHGAAENDAEPTMIGSITRDNEHIRGNAGRMSENTEEPRDLSHVQCVIDTLPEDLPDEQRRAATEFVHEYADIFSRSDFDLGRTDLLEHTIDTGDHRPFRQPLRRHPIAHLEVIDDHVNEMLKNDIIEPISNSAWASNVVLVKKHDGGLRFCVDYRRLNAITHKDSFPLPRIDTCLDSLGGSTFFSTLDL